MELVQAKDVRDYLPFAIIAIIFNPVLGLLAVVTSFQCRKARKQDQRTKTILYSDLTFGLSIVSVISTIIIIVLVYAFHFFPEHTYYDREEIIGA